MTSLGTSPITTVAALKVADQILGPHRIWGATNDMQLRWLEKVFYPSLRDLERVPEIVANATTDIAEHVAFLAKHGWQALLKDPLPKDGIATAAVLDVLVEWAKAGEDSSIRIPGGQHFAAFELKDMKDTGIVTVYAHRSMVGHVCELATKSEDVVFLMESERPPVSVLDLMDLVDRMMDTSKLTRTDYNAVAIPKVDLASKQSLDWIPGIGTTAENGHRYFVSQAMQQATLKMNEKGARARAADEMVITRSMTRSELMLTIDKPFLFAIKRRDVTKPIFCAYVDHDSWNDPGNLG